MKNKRFILGFIAGAVVTTLLGLILMGEVV